MATPTIPEVASRRLGQGPWSSGLSVADFAACVQHGIRPVALVQGFSVMRWTMYGADLAYARERQGRRDWDDTLLKKYRCPHRNFGESHRKVGQNDAQPFVENLFTKGFGDAFASMIAEAERAGAHGVVGVVDRSLSLVSDQVREFHVYGTAVVVEDGPPADRLWSTYLTGQRLVLMLENGLAPVSVVATMASVRVRQTCTTTTLMSGGWDRQGLITPDQEIVQMSDAHMAVRRRARERAAAAVRAVAPGGGLLHGLSADVVEREVGEADLELTCLVRGNAVRDTAGETAVRPLPTVSLG